MAALVTKPGAVEFFSFITNEYESDIAFEEIRYEEAPDICKDKSISDLHIRKNTGCNIIGYKSPSSRYIVNPAPDTLLVAKSSFIVLGSHSQIEALRNYLRNPNSF
jgi:voltage-gated potassium channel